MFDIGYFLRALAIFRRFKGKNTAKSLFDETIVKGRCWTNDLDHNWHMNNARYLRECDFGRIALVTEIGLWDAVSYRRKNGMKDANVMVSAFQIQYRQSIGLGDKFEIRTRLSGWDDKAFYLQQAMILNKNQKIAFLMLIRFALTPRSLTPQMLIDDLQIGSIESPKLSPTMQIFKDNYKLTYQDTKSNI